MPVYNAWTSICQLTIAELYIMKPPYVYGGIAITGLSVATRCAGVPPLLLSLLLKTRWTYTVYLLT